MEAPRKNVGGFGEYTGLARQESHPENVAASRAGNPHFRDILIRA